MNFLKLIKEYKNTEEYNNFIHQHFTYEMTKVQWLLDHRENVENKFLGYGDRAFHYMWFILLQHLKETSNISNLSILEIGVFKGQVISLWSLISKKINLDIDIHALSPFKGNPKPENRFSHYIKYIFSKKFRDMHKSSNFYEDDDYLKIVKNHFIENQLDFTQITTHVGFSNDVEILGKLKNKKFTLIYIDGDHTFEGVKADITNYAPLIAKNGFLIMDDASNNIPGSTFWKGHQDVSNAAEIIPSLGFVNVFNIGHNRVYQKI